MANEIVAKENVTKEVIEEIALESIISKVITLPGVKVDREKFLAETLIKETENIQEIIEKGPIIAGMSETTLKKISTKLIIDRTTKSSLTSFAMGIPGGLAMLGTIPADATQFFGMVLRLAQELTYLYGANDLWKDGKVDEEMVRSQLVLYCGVMFGIAEATAGVRLLSTQVSKVVLKKLPQKALTKTFWYPIIKKVGKSIGLTVTKNTFANGVSKVIPIVGGVFSGVLTFASMKSMAERLQKTLEDSNFHYNEEEINKDVETIENIDNAKSVKSEEAKKKSLFEIGKERIGGFFHKKDKKEEDSLEKIKKLKELLDMGAITQEEFDQKKKELL